MVWGEEFDTSFMIIVGACESIATSSSPEWDGSPLQGYPPSI